MPGHLRGFPPNWGDYSPETIYFFLFILPSNWVQAKSMETILNSINISIEGRYVDQQSTCINYPFLGVIGEALHHSKTF